MTGSNDRKGYRYTCHRHTRIIICTEVFYARIDIIKIISINSSVHFSQLTLNTSCINSIDIPAVINVADK